MPCPKHGWIGFLECPDCVELAAARNIVANAIVPPRPSELCCLNFGCENPEVCDALGRACGDPGPDLDACPHGDGNACEKYRLQGQRCQECPLLKETHH